MQRGSSYKLVIVVLVVVLLIGGLFYWRNTNRYSGEGLWPNYRIITKEIEGKNMRLVVAETPQQWSQGLMFVRKPVSAFDGMIFIFEEASVQHFWNKNTFMDLKLYWMYQDRVIGTSDLPSIEKSKQTVTVQSPAVSDTVVEFIQ